MDFEYVGLEDLAHQFALLDEDEVSLREFKVAEDSKHVFLECGLKLFIRECLTTFSSVSIDFS